MPTLQASLPASPLAAGISQARISPATFGRLQKHIYKSTGIVIDETKEYLLESRLNPIVQQMRFSSLEELCATLEREPASLAARMLVDAITTNETLFFRDIATFDALRQGVLPDLLKVAEKRRLRIWSAAASSGQEAYSLLIQLLEMGIPASRLELHATDISEQILDKARNGSYVQFEVNRGLPMALLSRYFTRAGLSWRVRDDLRQMVRFERHDLRDTYRNGAFDLVLCRNVLIYFDIATKQRVIGNLAAAMSTGSVLVLGCAESIAAPVPLLQRKVLQGSPFYIRTA